MNKLTIKQRKVVYSVGILLLLIPTMLLGMPDGAAGGRGHLAKLRKQHNLSETNLGNVDPTSATMNLVLLGFRGIAASTLWMQAEEQKKKKDWGALKSTVNSITLLQPHYPEVWKYQGWNLAFNVSVEWDGVEDRYYWVTEGTKFIIQGSDRNQHLSELPEYVGRTLSMKIGKSDEWKQYRGYFLEDPFLRKKYPEAEPGPDPILNPHGKDSYLVAKDWYLLAIDRDDKPNRRKKYHNFLFQMQPYLAQFKYGETLQREGKFGATTREAWRVGHNDYAVNADAYGNREFKTLNAGLITLNGDLDTLKELSLRDGYPIKNKKFWVDKNRKTTNYTYWTKRSSVEQTDNMNKAHELIIKGKRSFTRYGKEQEAFDILTIGMKLLDKELNKIDPELKTKTHESMKMDGDIIEEAIRAVIVWKAAAKLCGRENEISGEHPLIDICRNNPEAYQENQMIFDRQFGQ